VPVSDILSLADHALTPAVTKPLYQVLHGNCVLVVTCRLT
jgi:hypothetical protein